MWWIWNGAKRPPTLRPGQTTRAVSPPVGCQKPHPPSSFIIITQPESWYPFYHPTEGRRLSRPRHCSKCVQPVPKAVYRSDVYDKHASAHSVIQTTTTTILADRQRHSTSPATRFTRFLAVWIVPGSTLTGLRELITHFSCPARLSDHVQTYMYVCKGVSVCHSHGATKYSSLSVEKYVSLGAEPSRSSW